MCVVHGMGWYDGMGMHLRHDDALYLQNMGKGNESIAFLVYDFPILKKFSFSYVKFVK